VPALARFRRVPWLLVFELARVTWTHFGENVSERDRKRVAAILRRTKGDPRKLTMKEKLDLRNIGRRLNLAQLGRDLMPFGVDASTKKRR
jgi:hypothetical protein